MNLAENNERLITNALRYMKVPPHSHTPELTESVRGAFDFLEKIIEPRCIFGRFRFIKFDGGIEIEGASFYSNDIARLVSRSRRDECYLLAATLGHEVDRQILIAQQKDMLNGLALDACASVRIDSFIDEFIKDEIQPGLYEDEAFVSRFSPGYGDLSMNATEDIITILNATRHIGLSVTHSMMMTPLKSVTAFIGLRGRKEA